MKDYRYFASHINDRRKKMKAEEFFELIATLKEIYTMTNHIPQIDELDHAKWTHMLLKSTIEYYEDYLNHFRKKVKELEKKAAAALSPQKPKQQPAQRHYTFASTAMQQTSISSQWDTSMLFDIIKKHGNGATLEDLRKIKETIKSILKSKVR